MKQRIYLLSSQEPDQAFALGMAESMDAEIIHGAVASEAIAQAFQNSHTTVLADMSSEELFHDFEAQVRTVRAPETDIKPSNFLHAISPNDTATWSLLNGESSFGHLIVRMFEDPRKEGALYGQMIMKSRNGEKTGLAGLLGSDAEITVATMKCSDDRKTVLAMAESFLADKTEFTSRVAAVVLNAVDELLMNAIFDAPVDASGEQKLIATPRTSSHALEQGREVEVQIGRDSEYFGFTTTDYFGSLVKDRLFASMFRDTENAAYEVDSSKAGAGLGLSLVFRNGGSLLFVTKPGKRTDVTVLFKRDSVSFRALRGQFRYVAVQSV